MQSFLGVRSSTNVVLQSISPSVQKKHVFYLFGHQLMEETAVVEVVNGAIRHIVDMSDNINRESHD